MKSDVQVLEDLTQEMSAAEDRGDRAWLADVLAPKLAFQRADPQRTVDDHEAFLQKVKPGGLRQTRVIAPIEVYGDRAIVKCVVTVNGRDFHNIRLFVRREGRWKLLGWANEPCEPTPAPQTATPAASGGVPDPARPGGSGRS